MHANVHSASPFQLSALWSSTLFLLFLAAPALAKATIDEELAGEIDFRSTDYRVCLAKPTCSVGGLTISAQRRVNEESAWSDATIYWDPVDGLGVREGAQNDEVDFNERLIVGFEAPVRVSKIWFSDMFHSEDRRYGAGETNRVQGIAEDAESAGVLMTLDNVAQQNVLVEADDRLPWASFNQEISIGFRENGDMNRRVIIDQENVTIVAAGRNGSGNVPVQVFELAEIDPEKKEIFEGLETFEIDLTDILAEFNGTRIFVQGNTNYEYVRSLVEDPASLERLKTIAEEKRDTIRMSNGEVGWSFETVVNADNLQFFAPFDSSNDFSISGIVVE